MQRLPVQLLSRCHVTSQLPRVVFSVLFCFSPPPHALHVGIYPLGLQANINIFSLKLLASMPYFVCLYVYIRWQVCGLLLPQALVKKATSFPKLLRASQGFFTLWKLSLQGPCSLSTFSELGWSIQPECLTCHALGKSPCS